jgi:hypothetical protein
MKLKLCLSLGLIAVMASVGCASKNGSRQAKKTESSGSFQPARIAKRSAKPKAFAAGREVSVREIVLNGAQPVDLKTQIQLVSVQQDQTTVIRSASGEMMVGRPGDFFTVPGMKGQGIQLLMVSPQQGEALFEQRMVLNR